MSRAGKAIRAVALASLLPTAVLAQDRREIAVAFQLERQGNYEEAAREYRRMLDRDPAAVLALFGLERVLESLNRLGEIQPYIDSTLTRVPGDRTVRALQLRVLATLGRMDALDAAARAWIAADPATPDPYREWAFALAQRGEVLRARQVLEQGNERLGASALLQELAQISVVAGDWVRAARYWHAAAMADPDLGAAAGMALTQAPPPSRAGVLDVLLRDPGDAVSRRIGADVLVAWGEPEQAWVLLDDNLPQGRRLAVDALRRFADRARVAGTPPHHRVRGFALEKVARLARGAEAQQARIDAARAFADAGDRGAAERMLEQIAADSAAAPASAIAAMATLIAVEADAGRVDRAERRLDAWAGRLAAEDVTALRERIAWAWMRDGDLMRAERVVAPDSTLGTLAVRGWIALYRGDLAGAGERFREAGPFTGTRTAATDRTAMLALIQRIEADSAPALGRALLRLAVGDTARAIGQLAETAHGLPGRGGRAEVLAFVGRVAAEVGDARAPDLLAQALAADSAGPSAPVAAFTLAQLAARAGRAGEAVARLENLILTYPESAVVPQARRLLDQVRGAIPKS